MNLFIPDVLVVGAGPSGLTVACELARRGNRVRIIDKATEPATTSRALAIFPRTLEVFSAMGVAVPIIAAGQKLHGLSVHDQGGLLAHIEFGDLPTRYPFALSLPQSETERLLTDRLRVLGVEVERGVELTGLRQDGDAVDVTLQHSEGREEMLRVPWVVGCDGAHSRVRQELGVPFEGKRIDEEFVLADVRIGSPFLSDTAHLFFSSEGVFAVFPLGEGRGRVIANVPLSEAGIPVPTLDEFQELARRRGTRVWLSEPGWISRFHIAQRIVRDYRHHHLFLAGDAAHIHSPAGGQGMNTGIQDAFNLAWKLSLVIHGRAKESLLDSYNLERLPVAQDVLRMTGWLTRLATMRNPLTRRLRDFVILLASSFPSLEARAARKLTELSVEYGGSPIVSGIGSEQPAAGMRGPDATLWDRASGNAFRLCDLYQDPRHHLLLFRGDRVFAWEWEENVEWAAQFRSCLAVWEIGLKEGEAPVWDEGGVAHKRYGAEEGAIILMRPDGYIGFRAPASAMAALRDYLLTKLFLQPNTD